MTSVATLPPDKVPEPKAERPLMIDYSKKKKKKHKAVKLIKHRKRSTMRQLEKQVLDKMKAKAQKEATNGL